MEPNNQPNSAPEEQTTNIAMNNVPDAVEPDTSSTQTTQPLPSNTAADNSVVSAPQSSQMMNPSSTPLPSDNTVVTPTTLSSQSGAATTTPKKNTRLILVIVLGVLVVGVAGLMIYIATM